tara:strand:+ start:1430 stop:2476 length:1047 start_codon:yes stop_codon:yes gene_type:complete
MYKTYFLAIFISSLAFTSISTKAQIVINLVECSDCLWSSSTDSCWQWTSNWDSKYKPKAIFKKDYPSMAIGYVQINPDTILNTYIFHRIDYNHYVYWTGKKWLLLKIPRVDWDISGFGAFKKHLYTRASMFHRSKIYYYNGSKLSLIDSDSRSFAADLAVDSLGRAWYPARNPYNGLVDRLEFIDSSGTLKGSYLMQNSIDDNNLYGVAIVKGVIYIGAGPQNTSYPSSVLAYVIEGSTAVLAKVIPQDRPQYYFGDLASLSPGIPNPQAENPFEIFIYPNPAKDFLILDSKIPTRIRLELFDMQGQKLLETEAMAGESIKVSKLAAGTYQYRATSMKITRTGLIIKE